MATILGTTIGDTIDTVSASNGSISGGLPGAGADCISGLAGNDSIAGGGGNDTIAGSTDNDSLAGQDGADVLLGEAGNDLLFGGLGSDTLDGGSEADTLLGQDGSDSLLGQAGNDVLFGGAGNDTLLGGADNDMLYGGDGADSLSGSTGNDQLFGGRGNDTLDGSTGLDTLDGGAGNDSLTDASSFGLVTNQLMLGGEGDDTLRSIRGNDTLDGGSGNDIVLLASASSLLIDFAAGLITGRGGTDGDLIVLSGVERVQSSSGNDTFLGSDGDDGADLFTGSNSADGGAGADSIATASGADTLLGGDGADTLNPGTGADLVQGGDGDDVVMLVSGNVAAPQDTLDGGAGFDLLQLVGSGILAFTLPGGNFSDPAGGNYSITGFEGVVGTVFNDTLGGDTQDNRLDGGAGNDSLSGGAGADTLLGGSGAQADTLDGGAGNDSLDGGEGADCLDGGTGNDSLFGGEFAGADTLLGGDGFDLLDGGAGNDSLDGGSGFDSLIGGDGADTFRGGAGSDCMDGGAGNDLFIGDLDFLDRDTILGGGGSDTLSFAGLGDETGGASATLLGADEDASPFDDVIRGIDRVIGTSFDDRFELRGEPIAGVDAGDGNDRVTYVLPALPGFVIADFTALMQGGFGTDTLSFVRDASDLGRYDVDLSRFDIGFEIVEGSVARESLAGGTGNVTLRGNDGDDVISGGAGDDSLDGGGGNDRLDYGDTIAGLVFVMDAADRGFVTGQGSDRISGFETIAGSNVGDVFTGPAGGAEGSLVFQSGTGADTIDARGSLALQVALDSFGTGSLLVDLNAGTATRGDVVDVLTGVRNLTLGLAFGNHTVLGTAASERLEGGRNGDSIAGGGGADTLITGGGDDTLAAGSSAERVGAALLLDGSRMEGRAAGATGDRAYLSGGPFQKMVGFDRIENVADFSRITVGFIADLGAGTTRISSVVLNTFEGVRAIRGGAGADTLLGSGVAEEFDIAFGADSVDGGAGRDRIAFSNATGGVRVLLGAGQATEAGGAVDRFVNIEDVAGSMVADTLAGDASDNLLAPLGGADTVDGGGGNDTVSYAEYYLGSDVLPAGVTVNLFQGFAVDPWGSTDQLKSIEAAFGTYLGDELIGAILPNRGTSLLRGNEGNDIIRALVVDTGATADYSADPAAVKVNLGSAAIAVGGETLAGFTVRDGHGDLDLLLNVQAAWGSAFGDTMIGGARADTLTGWAGADSLRGGDGNDVLEGGAGADRLDGGNGGRDAASYEHAAAGVKASLAAAGGNTGEASGDTYVAIEDLIGSAFADTLAGNTAANRLTGGAGADSLAGGGGTDSLAGGLGDDTLVGGAGGDSLSGGDGFDVASYEGATAAVVASLSAPAGNTGDAAGDSYNAVEGLRGSGFDDRLAGNAVANLLQGGAGADTLVGNGGADTLTGGDGADRFLFNAATLPGTEADLVTDFVSGTDRLVFTAAAFGGLPAGVLAAANFSSGTAASSPVNSVGPQFVYQATTGKLFYDANGGGGADAVAIATLQVNASPLPTLLNTDLVIA